ncbi:hypothetical protein L2E82_23059 [Cichorium intybus]|uniref:Uncharacterized protein n=1 Tax=Cichorium intybus TaxID=13427 RepID=A0ACB9DZH2_CICIN|nr:hypothetical protein L2E82_23059 [Cichorium intybus]
MGNSLRCCLSCVLPCGALDLIRIVHLNGHVDEITRPITAADVLKDYPNHVLTKPSSHGVVRRILIISDNSQLKRGGIYFLIPSTSVAESKQKRLQKLKPAVAPVTASSSSDVMVVTTKKGGHRRARRTIHAGDWRPILESIFEEQ